MRFAIALSVLILAGCQQDPPLDRFEILRVVQAEKGFQNALMGSIPRTASAGCAAAAAATRGWQRLLQARVIELTEVRSGCEASLTAEVRQILGQTARNTQLNPVLEVPFARRNIVSIDSELPLGNGVEIRFTWNWDPNEIGKRIGLSSKIRTGRAELQLVRELWIAAKVDVEDTPDPLQ